MDKIFLINIIIKLFKKNKYTNMLVELYYKYKEVFDYLFFGVLVTIVNFVSYYIPSNIFHIDKIVSNVIAFVISVIFAYFVNKVYVFETPWDNLKETLRKYDIITEKMASVEELKNKEISELKGLLDTITKENEALKAEISENKTKDDSKDTQSQEKPQPADTQKRVLDILNGDDEDSREKQNVKRHKD